MISLLLAAAVANAPVVVTVTQAPDPDVVAANACARLTEHTSAPDGTPFKKLNELPEAVRERAVWRVVNGCPVREVVYQGQTYYDPSIPRIQAGPDTGSRMRRRDYSASPSEAPDRR